MGVCVSCAQCAKEHTLSTKREDDENACCLLQSKHAANDHEQRPGHLERKLTFDMYGGSAKCGKCRKARVMGDTVEVFKFEDAPRFIGDITIHSNTPTRECICACCGTGMRTWDVGAIGSGFDEQTGVTHTTRFCENAATLTWRKSGMCAHADGNATDTESALDEHVVVETYSPSKLSKENSLPLLFTNADVILQQIHHRHWKTTRVDDKLLGGVVVWEVITHHGTRESCINGNGPTIMHCGCGLHAISCKKVLVCHGPDSNPYLIQFRNKCAVHDMWHVESGIIVA